MITALLACLLLQDPDVDALLKQLGDDSIEVRDKAAAALVDLGDQAEEKVKARLATAEGELKQVCKRILERMAVPKKLRGVLPPLRKVTLDARERSVKEAFEDLRQQAGLNFLFQGVGEGNVTVSVKDLTPLEALDALCKAANLGYSFDRVNSGKTVVMGGGAPAPRQVIGEGSGSSIRIQPGYVSVARQFTRHYVIEPSQITMSKSSTFNQSYSNANVSLRVAWPADVRPQLGDVSVTSVIDDKGRELMMPAQTAGRYIRGSMPLNTGSLNTSIALTYPEADAQKLTLKGTVNLKYALEEKILSFDELEPAAPVKKERDGFTAELLELRVEGDRVTVKLNLTSPPSTAADPTGPFGAAGRNLIRVRQADGNLAPQTATSFSAGGAGPSRVEYQFVTRGQFKAVEVVLETIYHSDTFDFELKDIPLPK